MISAFSELVTIEIMQKFFFSSFLSFINKCIKELPGDGEPVTMTKRKEIAMHSMFFYELHSFWIYGGKMWQLNCYRMLKESPFMELVNGSIFKT